MRRLSFLFALTLTGLLVVPDHASADVTVVVASGNVTAQAAALVVGPGASDNKSRSLGPADFPGGTGPAAQVNIFVSDGEGSRSAGGSASSVADVSAGALPGGGFRVGAILSGSANATCTSPVEDPGAAVSAATSGALTVELRLDQPMDVEVTGALRALGGVLTVPPTPPPAPVAAASFTVGGVGGSVSSGNNIPDEEQVNGSVRLQAGVTVLQLQQSVTGANFSGCDQGKNGGTDIDVDLTFSPAPDESIVWINPLGGAWDVAGNWDPARVPAADDKARFELASVFTVQLGGVRTLAGARVGASLMDLAGGALILTGANATPALDLFGGARLTLLGASLQPANVTIGTQAGGDSSALRVGAAGVLDAGTVRVGAAAPGVLEVAGGSANVATTEVGGSEGAPELAGLPQRVSGVTAATTPDQAGGKVRIAGGQATLGNLRVGADGSGLVSVREGGLLRATGDARLGVAPGPAFAVVDGIAGGAVSTWESAGALIVGDAAEATFDVLQGGRASAQSIVVGAEPTGIGALTVAEFGPSGSDQSMLTTMGRLTVGDRGAGRLAVTGGSVQAAEVVAGLAAEGSGTIAATGILSRLSVQGLLAVGVLGTGRLELADNASVFANQLSVAFVTPAGLSTGPGVIDLLDDARLFVASSVTIGRIDFDTGATGAPGTVHVRSGSSLDVAPLTGGGVSPIDIQNGDLVVEGRSDFVGSRVRAGTVDMTRGTFRVADGARAEIAELLVIGTLGVAPVLEVADAEVRVVGTLSVGDIAEPELPGIVRLGDAGLVSVGGQLVVGAGGAITGTGRIRVGAVDVEPAGGTLTNLGTISAGSSPGTIAVDGGYAQGPGGRLVVEAAGTQRGQFDVLQVGGAAALGGTLVLRFLDGYLPQPGDALPFLTGNTTGAFAAVRVEGVAPGFDFTLAPAGGALVLTAKSAAQPAPCRDPADADGDGATCADTCPSVANADQADRDGDQIGDACDPCTGGVPLSNPVLTLRGTKLALRGTLALPDAAALDPAATGARIVIEDGVGQAVVTLDAPPGSFARASRRGWKARTFKSRKGPLRALALKDTTITARGVVSRVNPKKLPQPLSARILLDTTALPTARCAEAVFAGPAGVNPVCTARGGGLRCRTGKARVARAR